MNLEETGAALWIAISEWLPPLLRAALGTLRLMLLSFALAMSLGLLVAWARSSRHRAISRAAGIYIDVIRSTPLLTQLFLIYFGLVPLGIALPAFHAAVLGLGINGAAYLAEIYRAGIAAVDRGQREAAQSLGMTRMAAMRYIIMPQATRILLPPMANYAIQLLKETSIASLISAPELMMEARVLNSETFQPMRIYLLVGAIYLAMAYPLSLLSQALERRFNRGR